MSGNNYNTHDNSTTGGGLDKVRGAFETVHGVGDCIRARGMIALDNTLGTTQKNEEYARLAEQGRLEAESGMARLRGRNTTTGAGHGTGTGTRTMNDPIRSDGTESLEDGPSNTAGHGSGAGHGGVPGINATENPNAGSGFGIGGGNEGTRAGNTQRPQAPPELPARKNINNAPPGSQQMYD